MIYCRYVGPPDFESSSIGGIGVYGSSFPLRVAKGDTAQRDPEDSQNSQEIQGNLVKFCAIVIVGGNGSAHSILPIVNSRRR
jgi:hypothetical protein